MMLMLAWGRAGTETGWRATDPTPPRSGPGRASQRRPRRCFPGTTRSGEEIDGGGGGGARLVRLSFVPPKLQEHQRHQRE